MEETQGEVPVWNGGGEIQGDFLEEELLESGLDGQPRSPGAEGQKGAVFLEHVKITAE